MLDIKHDEGERDHENEMKKLDIKHEDIKVVGKIAEQEARIKVCKVFRCYSKGSFNILIKVLKLEFEEKMKQNKRNG